MGRGLVSFVRTPSVHTLLVMGAAGVAYATLYLGSLWFERRLPGRFDNLGIVAFFAGLVVYFAGGLLAKRKGLALVLCLVIGLVWALREQIDYATSTGAREYWVDLVFLFFAIPALLATGVGAGLGAWMKTRAAPAAKT